MAFRMCDPAEGSNLQNLPANIIEYPEAASQSFPYGALVVLSSGKVAVAGAISATYASADLDSGTAVFGRALKAATGVTDSPIPVMLIQAGVTVQRLPLITSASTSTNSAGPTLAQSMIGAKYDIAQFTQGGVTVVGVTQDDTTNPNVFVFDAPPEEFGKVNGEVYVVFTRTQGS